jgi:xanthine dehydrogenase small subunit
MQPPLAPRFWLNGSLHEANNANPCATLLDYLRETAGLCGTKEGCAEGDCGACTVVVGDVSDGRMRYRAINACIALVSGVDGMEVLTVEGLANSATRLHPVQQAMVTNHASQCGFCTPGFVMSLFALYKSEEVESRHQIDDALAGNLCRCTGYRPIVDAGLSMQALAPAERTHRLLTLPGESITPDEAEVVETLAQLRRPAMITFVGNDVDGTAQSVLVPRTLDELLQAVMEHPQATLIAGCTEVGVWVNKRHDVLGTAIRVNAVDELTHITVVDDALHIGAAAPLSAVHDALLNHYPELDEIMRRFASPPVRNAATLGGNLANASPIGDTPPVLIALDARVAIASVRHRREVPVAAFFRDYRKTVLADDEVITHVVIPPRRADVVLRAYKVTRRVDQDISCVCAAFAVRLDGGSVVDARVGYGGVGPTPLRLIDCEQALVGAKLGFEPPTQALDAVSAGVAPIGDVRASETYRRQVSCNLLRRFFLDIAGDEPVRLQMELLS